MRKYSAAVIIGRFQPFHNGHKYLIEQAFIHADRVLVLVGSSNRAATFKNPFTFEERRDMIMNSIHPISAQWEKRISVQALDDFPYNDEKWVAQIQSKVDRFCDGATKSVTMVGYKKDQSTYYLDYFSQWGFVEVDYKDKLDATDVREVIFERKPLSFIQNVVPPYVFNLIADKIASGSMNDLFDDYNEIKTEKAKWAGAPFPPTFYTADPVVIQQGHVLLVTRGNSPGKGLLALPGGHVEFDETSYVAALRELDEETGLKVCEKVLRGSTIASHMFDHPTRSLRGRVASMAYAMHLTNLDQGLPKVKPPVHMGEVRDAKFYPIANIDPRRMFDDHWFIIQWALDEITRRIK